MSRIRALRDLGERLSSESEEHRRFYLRPRKKERERACEVVHCEIANYYKRFPETTNDRLVREHITDAVRAYGFDPITWWWVASFIVKAVRVYLAWKESRS